MIYIIDDDKSVQRGFLLLVQSAGCEAKAFLSVDEFFEGAELTDRDCIITDLRMPGRDGFQLMEELRSRRISVPVIVVTAYDNAESRQLAWKLGAKAFFRKPVDDQTLIEAINWSMEEGRKTQRGESKA